MPTKKRGQCWFPGCGKQWVVHSVVRRLQSASRSVSKYCVQHFREHVVETKEPWVWSMLNQDQSEVRDAD